MMIRVGGVIPAGFDLDRFAALVDDWGDGECPFLPEGMAIDDLVDAAEDDGLLHFDAYESGTECEALLAFLLAQGVGYDAHWEDDGSGCTDSLERWRPGMAEPAHFPTAYYGGEAVVDRGPVRDILAALDELRDVGPRLDHMAIGVRLSNVAGSLRGVLGQDVPDLEPISVAQPEVKDDRTVPPPGP